LGHYWPKLPKLGIEMLYRGATAINNHTTDNQSAGSRLFEVVQSLLNLMKMPDESVQELTENIQHALRQEVRERTRDAFVSNASL